ncbi:MAG: enoyl-CoA hydratase/isomerase family protein [Deltaproteobacteria bacterium]|nr:enoyl-CoA hydratase/isomerase family protein [Deltaproteobacteria bacterium]
MKPESVLLEFHPIDPSERFTYASITLNRPDKANALNGDMLKRLRESFASVAEADHCRFLIIRNNGKHFSAGADLEWMKSSAELSYEENLQDAERLSQVFDALFQLEVPTIAVVRGLAYGGALGLIACCDFAIASEASKFSLSEVKLGLLPAVILPFLSFKMQASTLRRVALTAEVFSAEDACKAGLVTLVSPEDKLSDYMQTLTTQLLQGGPHAHRRLKNLLGLLTKERQSWSTLQKSCYQTIAKARTGEEGQHGLSSFLSGKKPAWVQTMTNLDRI